MASQHGKVASLSDVVSTIPDGAHLTFSGFAHSLAPIAVVHELIRQGKKGFELSSMGECWAADFLIGAGRLERVRVSSYMFEGYGRCMNFARAAQDGRLGVEDYSHFGITSRFMAGALGVSFLPTKVMAGTDIVRLRPFDDDKAAEVRCPFTDEEYTAVRAVHPDVAIIHASRADVEGNVQVFGSTSIIEEQARAAKRVIVSVEEIVDTSELARHPEWTLLPGFMVEKVIEIPFGAHPAGMFRYYDHDDEHIRKYWQASRATDTFQAYLDEFVLGTKDHWDYLQKIGTRKLMSLRADPGRGH